MNAPVSRSKAPLMGIILVVLAGIIVAVAVGVAEAAIKIYLNLYLIIVFPLIMAVLVGWIVNRTSRIGKLRNATIASVLAVLIGLLAYGSYRYAEYVFFQQQLFQTTLTQVTETAGQPLTPDQLSKFKVLYASEFQKDDTVSTFPGFVQARAKEGVAIQFGSSVTDQNTGTDLTLSEPLTWGYWALEILVICGVAVSQVRKSSNVPFCDRDNRFFVTKKLGRVDKTSADQFMALAKAGDWRGASALIDSSKGKVKYPYLIVTLQKCPTCNTNPIPLRVIRKLSSRASSEKIALKATLTPAQYDDLTGTVTIPGMLPA